MKVIQSYNQNAVSVLDKDGSELVLIGRGIGFGKKKGDTIDISKASKVFKYYYTTYEKKLIESLNEVPEDILLMSEEITVKASELLEEELNPAFLFSLSMHIQYALDRAAEYGEIINPFSYELKYIYPKEYQAAQWSVDYLRKKYNLFLYDSEIIFFTLHFVNGLQSSTSQFNEVVKLSNILGNITELIDREFHVPINKDSLFYSRFILHLRYFILRKLNGDYVINEELEELYHYASSKFLEADTIVCKIDTLLKEKYEFDFEQDENLYLMLHVQRLIDENLKRS